MEAATIDSAPIAQKPKKPRKPKKAAAKPSAEKTDEFAGLTANSCPNACTKKRCVISTVNVCKHPMTAPASGCGPKTLANREKALKIIKRQKIDKG